MNRKTICIPAKCRWGTTKKCIILVTETHRKSQQFMSSWVTFGYLTKSSIQGGLIGCGCVSFPLGKRWNKQTHQTIAIWGPICNTNIESWNGYDSNQQMHEIFTIIY